MAEEVSDIEIPPTDWEETIEDLPWGMGEDIQVPSMRETTPAEYAGGVAGRLVGGLGGITTGIAKGLWDVATLPVEAAQAMFGADEEPSDVVAGYQEASKRRDERLGHDFVANAIKNMEDVYEGFVTVLTAPFDIPEQVPEEQDFVDVITNEMSKAYDATEVVPPTVYGDLASLVNPVNLIENIQTRPLDTILVMYPVAKAALRYKPVRNAARNVLKKVEPIVNSIINTERYAVLKRWIDDPSAQSTPELQEIARKFLEESEEFKSRFNASVLEAANRLADAPEVYVGDINVRGPKRTLTEGEVKTTIITEAEAEAAVAQQADKLKLSGLEAEVLDSARRSVIETYSSGREAGIPDPQIDLRSITESLLKEFPPAVADEIIAALARETSPMIARALESATGFKLVLDGIKNVLDPVTWKQHKRAIVKDLKNWMETNKSALAGEVAIPIYETAAGVKIDMVDIINNAIMQDGKLNTAVATEVLNTAAKRVLPELATQSYKILVDDILGAKGDILTKDYVSPLQVLTDLLQPEFIAKPTEGVLSRMMPIDFPTAFNIETAAAKSLLNQLKETLKNKANRAAIAEDIASTTKRSYDDVLANVNDIADRFNKLVPISASTGELLGYRAGSIAVPKGLESTLKWHQRAMAATINDGFLWKLNRFIKANLTVLNPSTHVNNFLSNLFLQTIRRANPLKAYDLVNINRLYMKWKRGKAVPDDLIEIFHELDGQNLIETSLVDIELGVSDGARTWNPYKKLSRGAKRLYRFGDTMYKVEEFVHAYKKLKNAFRRMEVGSEIKLMPRRGTKIILKKVADNTFKLKDKILTEVELQKIMGRTSSQAAKNLFFDYADIGNYAKMLKSVPVLGILSPFYIWFYKAMDLPFFKKGLVSHSATDRPWISSTSDILNTSAAAHDMLLATRRGSIMSGLQHSLKDGQEFKEVLNWLPKDMGVFLLKASTDPGYAYFKDFKWSNPYEATGMLIDSVYTLYKLAENAISDANLPVELHLDQTKQEIKDDPELTRDEKHNILQQRNWWHEYSSGKRVDMATAANIAGAAGSYFFDILEEINRSEKQGVVINKNRLYRTMMSAMMGGAFQKGLRATLGLSEEARDMPVLKDIIGRRQPDFGIEDESDLRWFFRTLTGQLLKHQDVMKSADFFFKGLKKEYSAAVLKPLEKRADDAMKVGDYEKAEQLLTMAAKYEVGILQDLAETEVKYIEQIMNLKGGI